MTVNPLTELPLIGPVVATLDKPLSEAGVQLWLAEAGELLVVAGLTLVLLRMVIRRFLPWLFAVAVGPAVALLRVVQIVLLLPQLGLTVAYDRVQRPPARAVYSYGRGVMDITDALEASARRVLPQCGGIRKLPNLVLVLLLVLVFALWNNSYCNHNSEPHCVSPVTGWVAQL